MVDEKRYKIIRSDGSSFLAQKGQSYKDLTSWQKAFNKHNGNRIAGIIEVKRRLRKKSPKNPFEAYINKELRLW